MAEAAKTGDAAGEAGRAEIYTLLAALLSAPPSRALIAALQTPAAKTPETAAADSIDALWTQLADAARDATVDALEDEYHDLFIGLGRGEVVPFASWHLTGFLMEKPLSDLRDDLKSLGLTADAAQKDPEDHIAALCESMALIIRAADIDTARERQFFARHIGPWAGKFFAELQAAKAANFYRAVGALGARFVDIEAQYVNFPAN